MKKLLFFLLLSALVLSSSGQQVFLETGMVFSSFDYKTSNGSEIENLKGSNRNCFGLGVRMPVMKSPWHALLEVSNNKYGATGTDPDLGNFSEWDVSYLSVNLGVDYEFFKPKMINIDRNGLSFYIRGLVATEFLLSGKQKLNSQVYDLSGEEEFDKPAYFLKGGIGANYYITRSYIVFVQYIFGRSILLGNYSGQEKLNYTTNTISIGISLDLSYRRD
jgi:hypothetical protein